jgi:hypothetical protein
MVKSLQKLVNAGARLPEEMAAPFPRGPGPLSQARVKPYQVESTAKLFSIDFEERARALERFLIHRKRAVPEATF